MSPEILIHGLISIIFKLLDTLLQYNSVLLNHHLISFGVDRKQKHVALDTPAKALNTLQVFTVPCRNVRCLVDHIVAYLCTNMCTWVVVLSIMSYKSFNICAVIDIFDVSMVDCYYYLFVYYKSLWILWENQQCLYTSLYLKVTCPGVWICPKGMVYLDIWLFGCNSSTSYAEPKFPLVFNETISFHEVIYYYE